MDDAQAIDFLVARQSARVFRNGTTGQTSLAAEALGITAPRLSMWKSRGIPLVMRETVREVLNLHGAKLPLAWALPAYNAGNSHGRKSKSRRKAKQQGAAKKGRRHRAKESEARA